MGFIVFLYIVLLVIFLVISVLIFRYIVKFSYLSPRFKGIVSAFAVIALIVIIFSIYLLIRGHGENTSPAPSKPRNTNNSSDLNF